MRGILHNTSCHAWDLFLDGFGEASPAEKITPSTSTNAKVGRHHPRICHPVCPGMPWDRATGFPATPPHQHPRMRLSVKESRMKLANATNLNRKSGGSGAEGSAVCVDGETEPRGDSPTALSLRPKVKLQITRPCGVCVIAGADRPVECFCTGMGFRRTPPTATTERSG
jgi:hypothetical protein